MSSAIADAQVVVAWSAAGATGRTAVLAAVACELAKANQRVLVIDADVHAPSMVQVFGFDQNYSGLSAAIRMQSQGELEQSTLEPLLLDFEMSKHRLKILPGITMVNRWPEIGFDKLRSLIAFASEHFDFVMVDIGASIETSVVDARLLTERNAATLAALSVANHVIALTTADVVGMNRFIWASEKLRDLKLEAKTHVVVNRFNQDTLGRNAVSEVSEAVARFTGHEVAAFIEEDCSLFARALNDGMPVSLIGKNSAAKQAISQFALGRLLNLPSKSSRRLAKLG